MDKKDNPKMDMSYFTSDENPEELFISGIKVKNLMKQYKFSKNDLEPYLPLRTPEYKKNKTEFHFLVIIKSGIFMTIIIMQSRILILNHRSEIRRKL